MQSPKYLPIVKSDYADKIEWYYLSQNPNAISILKQNPDKIHWGQLSENPNAMDLLKQNPHKIDWNRLSKNPNAMDLLKQNPDKIDWCRLSYNPNVMEIICDLDYDVMKKSMAPFAEELTMKVFHPLRMNRIAQQYNIPFDELITEIY
jgi:ribosomal protein L24E